MAKKECFVSKGIESSCSLVIFNTFFTNGWDMSYAICGSSFDAKVGESSRAPECNEPYVKV